MPKFTKDTVVQYQSAASSSKSGLKCVLTWQLFTGSCFSAVCETKPLVGRGFWRSILPRKKMNDNVYPVTSATPSSCQQKHCGITPKDVSRVSRICCAIFLVVTKVFKRKSNFEKHRSPHPKFDSEKIAVDESSVNI